MQTRRVLIVDDDPTTVAGLVANLEYLGDEYIIESADCGERALEKVQKSNYALVITDLFMPGIDGWELIKRLRIVSPQTRLILITAYPPDDIERKSNEFNVFRFLAKPFPPKLLIEAAHEALQGPDSTKTSFRGYSDACLEALSERLAELRLNIGARCVVLADATGQLIAREGYSEGIDLATLLALIAGGFATAAEMARCLGDTQALNLHYHEGTDWDIYAASLSAEICLVMLFDKKSQQSSRIGMVWLFAKRTIVGLLEMIKSDQNHQASAEVGEEFKHSLSAEIDTLIQEGDWQVYSESDPAAAAQEAAAPIQDDAISAQDESISEHETIPLTEARARGLIPRDLYRQMHEQDDEGQEQT
jgi:CheY-like chemotaxis protein